MCLLGVLHFSVIQQVVIRALRSEADMLDPLVRMFHNVVGLILFLNSFVDPLDTPAFSTEVMLAGTFTWKVRVKVDDVVLIALATEKEAQFFEDGVQHLD